MPEKKVVLRPHAPLMWACVAIMAGYSLAEAWAGVRENALWLGILAAVSFVGAFWMRKASPRAKLYAAAGVFALAALYYSARETRAEVTVENRAPREAELIIEPMQSFALRAESGREAGLGVIRSGELAGQKVNYSVRWKISEPLELHSRIKMFGVLAPNKRGGEGFDEYLERSHVGWSLTRGDAREVTQPANAFWHGIAVLRRGALEVLHRRWGNQADSGLLAAMVMGDKAELTPRQKENFVRSGTMHLVAISGLNVMAVAFVMWGLLKLTGLPRTAQAVLVVCLLALYALMTGAGASVWRAWGMVALALSAWALRRQMNLWAVVVLAATISLMIEPLSFMHAGWRLSFGVVSGIVLGMGAVERWGILERFRGWPGRILSGILGTLIVSLVAGISVAPMTAAYWGLAQPLGFVVNAVAVTLAGLVTILGTVSWLVAWIPGASALVNELSYVLLGWIDAAIEAYLKIPGGVVEVTQAKAAGVEIWGMIFVLCVFYIFSRYSRWKSVKKFATAKMAN